MARERDFVGVKYQLYEGKDINEKDVITGTTALMESCIQGDMETIELLLDRKANLDIQDKEGNTALMHALRENRANLVSLLADKGANLNLKDRYGSTPVNWASFHNKVDMVMLLTEKGADLLIADDSGRTALTFAKEKGFKDMMIKVAHLRAVSKTFEEAMAKKNPPKKEDRFYRPNPDPGIYWDDLRLDYPR